jgi:PAS domain S-box-containing protein
MKRTRLRSPLALALLYALFAGLWILLPDRLLTALTTDPALLTLLQTVKGEAFIAATALLLFLFMRRELQRRERRDAQILEIEQHLRLQSTVLESAANAIVITDREGRILWVNPAFTRLTGYAMEEARGQTLRLLKSGQHEAAIYQALWETILSGRVWHGEMVNRRKDGSLYTAEQTITPVREPGGQISHFIGISQDVTERKRTEAALRESEEKFRNLVENTSDWVWEINERGLYTYVSPRVRDILGYAPEELLGKTPFDVMPADEAKRVAEIFAPISGRMEPFVLLDNVNLHKAGHRVVLETSGVPIFDSQGRWRGYRGIDRDITSRKTAEETLAKRTRQLEALREVTGEITQELDLTAVLRLITRRAEELVGGESGAIYLWDEAAQLLIPRAWQGLGDWVGEIRRRLDDGVTGIVAARRQGLIVNDYRNSPYRNPLYVERTGITAALAEPLLYRDRLLGVITVNRDENCQPFTEPDRQILSLFAHQAAVAIENARLHETAVGRARQLTTLTELTRALTTVLDSHQVAREILAAAQVLIPGAVGRLWEWRDQNAEPRLVAAVGLRDAMGGHRPSRQSGDGVAGLAASTRKPVIIPEVASDPRFLNREWAAAEDLVSCLILPLLYADRVTGVLAIYTRSPHNFADEEVSLLLSFAGQAAIAIENARLYEAIRQHAVTLEQRVQERTRSLQTVNRELQAASRHKSAFLANMSHELRTPLNSIIGFAEVLLDQTAGPVTEKQARFLGHIHQSGKHLLDLINDILDLSKVEAGKLTLKPRALSVPITLGDVLVLTRALATKRSQRLLVDIEADLPSLQADPVRFKQICFNLLSNAVKFTPNGGTIWVTARRLTGAPATGAEELGHRGATAQGEGPPAPLPPASPTTLQFLEIRVRDTGIGIREADLPRLFQDFVQLESVETKRHEGTGLGLALTRRLVELHGGRIWVESEGVGQGSTFTILLPFTPSAK